MGQKNQPAFHGSDLEQIGKYYGIPTEEIISFGANVNPLGLSDSVREAVSANLDVITRYPEREYTSLRRTIAGYCGTDMEYVAVGNGSTELISLLISHCHAGHALIIGPTYSEYKRELSLTGSRMSFYHLQESESFRLSPERFLEEMPADVDLVILCNPNNPTSSIIPVDDLEIILTECKNRSIFVMIDETYVEFAPCVKDVTAVPLVGSYDNLMVIRGVSKFFAAPGLRLGYGITSSLEFLNTLKRCQNPWSLNSIGAFAGEVMLKDQEFIDRTRNLIQTERRRICLELDKLPGVRYYEPYANFILVRLLKEGLTSFDVFEHTIKKGLMIRDCSSFECLEGEYIRFCIMNRGDNDRLLAALKECLQGCR